MALGESPHAAAAASGRRAQISKCLTMIEEAQRMLAQARGAELVLTSAQHTLADILHAEGLADVNVQSAPAARVSTLPMPPPVATHTHPQSKPPPSTHSAGAFEARHLSAHAMSPGAHHATHSHASSVTNADGSHCVAVGHAAAPVHAGNQQPAAPHGLAEHDHSHDASGVDQAASPTPTPASTQTALRRRNTTLIDQVLIDAMEVAGNADNSAGVEFSPGAPSTPRGASEKDADGMTPSRQPRLPRVQSRAMGQYRYCYVTKWNRIPFPVLVPESSIRLAWDLTGIGFIVYETYAIPYNIAFDYDPGGLLFMFVSIINIYFILDIFLTFFTGFRNAAGGLVVTPARIAKNYARGMLIPDILAGIPWEWLPIGNKVGQITKMMRFLRLSRLLRLLRIGVIADQVKIAIEANPALGFAIGVLRVVLVLLGLTHWTACAWYMIGTRDVDATTWVQKFIPENADDGVHYLYSCFFTLTTMTTVGYGDITAQNPGEVLFAIFLLLVSAIIFPGILSAITELLDTLNLEKHQMSEKMQSLGKYMRWRNVPQNLFLDVRSHLQFLWETNKGYDAYEEEVKAQLPPVLRKELCYHIYGSCLRRAPFFAWMRDIEICLKELSNLVETMIMSKGDSLFRVGQPNEQIYILLTGTVRLSLNECLFVAEEREGEDLLDHGAHDDDIQHQLSFDGERQDPEQTAKDWKKAKVLEKIAMMMRRNRKGGKDAKKTLKKSDAGSRSQVLEAAEAKLMEVDADRKWAASFIQRRWRIIRASRDNKKRLHAHHERNLRKQGHVQTMTMSAPCHFGESCLWVPIEEWDSDVVLPYTYNVRCESRVQLVYISRSMIKEIIERFSPWLLERFEIFQQAVVEGHSEHSLQSHSLSDLAASQPPDRFQSQAHGDGSINLGPAPSPPLLPRGLTVPAGVPGVIDRAAAQAFQGGEMNRTQVDELWASIRSRAADLTRRSRLAATRLEQIGQHRTFGSVPALPDLSRATAKDLPAMPAREERRHSISSVREPMQRRDSKGLREPLLLDFSGGH